MIERGSMSFYFGQTKSVLLSMIFTYSRDFMIHPGRQKLTPSTECVLIMYCQIKKTYLLWYVENSGLSKVSNTFFPKNNGYNAAHGLFSNTIRTYSKGRNGKRF